MQQNHQPDTAMNDLVLQLAVSSTLQFQETGNKHFLQDCKDCRLQMGFRFAEIEKTKHE